MSDNLEVEEQLRDNTNSKFLTKTKTSRIPSEIKEEKNKHELESVEIKDIPAEMEVMAEDLNKIEAHNTTNQSCEAQKEFVNDGNEDSKESDQIGKLLTKDNKVTKCTSEADGSKSKSEITDGTKQQAKMTSKFQLPGQPKGGQQAASNLTAAEFTRVPKKNVSSLKFPCFFQKLGEKVVSNLIEI